MYMLCYGVDIPPPVPLNIGNTRNSVIDLVRGVEHVLFISFQSNRF